MISDITMGQFFPGKSVVHRMDPRVKLCLTVFFIVMIFCAKNFVTMAITILMCFAGILLTKVPLKLYRKSLKPIMFIVVFTAILNLFYGTGEPLVAFGPITITMNGIMNSIMIAVRIIVLILISSVLTFTTSPTQLTDAIERLLKPLAVLHVPVHEFAMMMTIALRFVPTLLEETEKIMAAISAAAATAANTVSSCPSTVTMALCSSVTGMDTSSAPITRPSYVICAAHRAAYSPCASAG